MPTRKLGLSRLMKAVYERLTTNALTSAYRIYNAAPKTAALPYVIIGDPSGLRSYSFSSREYPAEDNVVTIHIWSEYAGDKEAADMMNNIIQAITGTDWTLTTYYDLPLVLFEFGEIFIDDSVPTALKRHGVMRFRFHMTPS